MRGLLGLSRQGSRNMHITYTCLCMLCLKYKCELSHCRDLCPNVRHTNSQSSKQPAMLLGTKTVDFAIFKPMPPCNRNARTHNPSSMDRPARICQTGRMRCRVCTNQMTCTMMFFGKLFHSSTPSAGVNVGGYGQKLQRFASPCNAQCSRSDRKDSQHNSSSNLSPRPARTQPTDRMLCCVCTNQMSCTMICFGILPHSFPGSERLNVGGYSQKLQRLASRCTCLLATWTSPWKCRRTTYCWVSLRQPTNCRASQVHLQPRARNATQGGARRSPRAAS